LGIVPTEVVATDEFLAWFERLADEWMAAYEAVYSAVNLLEEQGVFLGYPQSSAIQGSKYALRELRIQCKGHRLRVFYIFDQERQAVVILGGDKQGDDRFYEREVPRAEKIWEQYKQEMGL
jgi:hypothetical protein